MGGINHNFIVVDLKKHFNICSKKWSTQKQERSRWNVPVFYEAISIKVEIAIDG